MKLKINSLKNYKLDQIGATKIILKKIKVLKPIENRHLYLGMPIQYETKYPNGSVERGYIHAMNYFDNYKASAKFAATNMDIEIVLPYCKYTSLIISHPIADNTEIEFEVEFEKLNSILINIYLSETIDGFSFELSPDSKNNLRNEFPNIIVAGRMLVARDTLRDFQTIYGTINPYIIEGLTGLKESDINKIDYQIINAKNEKIIYSSIKRR